MSDDTVIFIFKVAMGISAAITVILWSLKWLL